MAGKDALVVRLRITGVRETLAALNRLPKEASQQLKDRSQKLAGDLAGKIRQAATREGRQAAALAKTVRARRDRLPVVQAGGTRKVGRHKAPAWGLVFASEFGMNAKSGWYAKPRYEKETGRQYKPHLGRHSYWFFTTVDDNQAEIATQWREAADEVVRSFEGGV